ncbi:MAG: hypothetical protein M1835_003070 [Candelina submexicana]|nr:MAG: hypothetical protein M1835_003070 [Candelina submexicana]
MSTRAYATTPSSAREPSTPASKAQVPASEHSRADDAGEECNPDIDPSSTFPSTGLPIPPNIDDTETPTGDMSDMYHPEGDFGISRPWLRAEYDIDAEEVDYSEEIAAWEKQKEETGESIYIPPGKTLEDFISKREQDREKGKKNG